MRIRIRESGQRSSHDRHGYCVRRTVSWCRQAEAKHGQTVLAVVVEFAAEGRAILLVERKSSRGIVIVGHQLDCVRSPRQIWFDAILQAHAYQCWPFSVTRSSLPTTTPAMSTKLVRLSASCRSTAANPADGSSRPHLERARGTPARERARIDADFPGVAGALTMGLDRVVGMGQIRVFLRQVTGSADVATPPNERTQKARSNRSVAPSSSSSSSA